jgi:hypothetical protein
MVQEEQIYDLITNSAKMQFDYATFEKNFSIINESIQPYEEKNIADKILWLTLLYIAMGDKPNIIALKIRNELMMSGFIIENISSLEKFVSENIDNWNKEVGILKMASDMLNSNFASLEQVYDLVSKTLSE